MPETTTRWDVHAEYCEFTRGLHVIKLGPSWINVTEYVPSEKFTAEAIEAVTGEE